MAVGRLFSKDFFESKTFRDLTDRERACYTLFCAYADDDGFTDNCEAHLRLYGYDFDVLDSLEKHKFIKQFPKEDGDRVALFLHFFANNPKLSETTDEGKPNPKYKKSPYHDLLKGFTLKRRSEGGDGIYYEKKPTEAEIQENETASKVGDSSSFYDNPLAVSRQDFENNFIEGTDQEQTITESFLSDEQVRKFIKACSDAKEHWDGDVTALKDALERCLSRKELGFQEVVMATAKYYNPNNKTNREVRWGETLSVYEFLSDPEKVLKVYKYW